MRPTIDINKRLADYIYDDLSPEEQFVMEREMEKDPDFLNAYQLNSQVKDYLKAKIQLEEMKSDPLLEDAEQLADLAFDLEYTDKKVQATIPGGKRKKIRRFTYTAAIAASLALLISFGILPSRMNQDRLFEQYYTPMEASDYSQRGEANALFRELAQGINFYMDGEYQYAIDQFKELAADPVLQPEVRFFTALSYLGLGQYPEAQDILESGLSGNNRYQAEILWYLSLSYLKSGEFNKAHALLTKLELYDGLYKKDAQALLRKLRRFK